MTEQKPQPHSRHEFESRLIAKAWQDEAFKQELISNPKAVYTQELGQEIPNNLTIQVLEETSSNLYLVLPVKPSTQVSEELSDEALEAVAGGGVAVSVAVSVLAGYLPPKEK